MDGKHNCALEIIAHTHEWDNPGGGFSGEDPVQEIGLNPAPAAGII
jgi:hypothetical protein